MHKRVFLSPSPSSNVTGQPEETQLVPLRPCAARSPLALACPSNTHGNQTLSLGQLQIRVIRAEPAG